MDTGLLATIIVCVIIGVSWGIYVIMHVTRRCLTINREHRERMRELNRFSEQVRRFIQQHEERERLNQQNRRECDNNSEHVNWNEITLEPNNTSSWMTEPFDNTTDENCVICLNELTSNCIMTKCYHKFHLKCIKTWEKVSHESHELHEKNCKFSCPCCKQNLYEELESIIID